MVGTSKILTVSYGTFSCTLEGFDEPFSTMRSIAEYFRDLAADDRYFGAEPPTPDAEMLHRIAEREIQRRVIARVDEDSVTLTPAPEDPADRDDAPRARPSDAGKSRLKIDKTRARERAMAEVEAPVQMPAKLPESIADKMLRIRAAAARSVASDALVEDQAASFFARPIAAAFDAEPAPMPAAELAMMPPVAEAPEIVADAPLPDQPDADRPVAANDIDIAATIQDEPDETEPSVDDADRPLAGDGADLWILPAAEPETPAEAPRLVRARVIKMRRPDAEPDVDETEADTAEPPAATTPSADATLSVEIARVTAEFTLPAGSVGDAFEDQDPVDDAAGDDIASMPDFVAERKSDTTTHAAADHFGTEADDGGDAAGADDNSDAVSVNTRESLADDRNDTSDALADDGNWDALAVIDSHGIDSATLFADQDAAEVDADEAENLFDEIDWNDDPAADYDDDDHTDDQPAAPALTGSTLSDDAEAALLRELAEVESQTAAAAAETEGDGWALVDDGQVGTVADDAPPAGSDDETVPGKLRLDLAHAGDDASVDRILAETNSQLDDSEASRRRSTIAHLKAAVAATRADRDDGIPEADGSDEINRYRDDLDRVVRPRRPGEGRTATTRRLAPLMLVSEQRVDTPHPDAMADAVRPRRITAGNLALMQDEDHDDETDDAPEENVDLSSFADYAEKMGATQLPDLVEAAAAFAAFVEGRPHVSRPQLMRRAASAQAEFSREDGLRAFGTLLRQGRIQKLKRGQFTVARNSRFRPDQAQA